MYFRGRDLIFAIIMITAMMPFEAIIVPLYMVMRSLELTNSYFALFLPWIANPFGIFLLRQTFIEIPRDYDEAAKVEGASYFQIFWHIILPNSRPALVTLALISFLLSWNSFMWPLIVMHDPDKQLIQVAIATFTQPGELPKWGNIFAGATAATIPILIIFLALQRYYVRGVVMSGVKG
jgi:ABC-type glycerol-3-phosphate transport system permease component